MWGVRIQGDYVVTGSMDGTIALIDINTMQIKKHFLAHENEWGSKKKTRGHESVERPMHDDSPCCQFCAFSLAVMKSQVESAILEMSIVLRF